MCQESGILGAPDHPPECIFSGTMRMNTETHLISGTVLCEIRIYIYIYATSTGSRSFPNSIWVCKFSCGLKIFWASHGSLARSFIVLRFKWWGGRGAIWWSSHLSHSDYLLTWEEPLLDLSPHQRAYLECDEFFRSVIGFWAELLICLMDFNGSMIHCKHTRRLSMFVNWGMDSFLRQWRGKFPYCSECFLATALKLPITTSWWNHVKPSSLFPTLPNAKVQGWRLPSWLYRSYLDRKHIWWITCSLAIYQLL